MSDGPVDLAVERSAATGCVDLLRKLTAKAERGEIASITAICETPDGQYDFESSATRNRLTSAGALLDAAMQRLGYTPEGDE